ncbi:mitochondrial matrix iron-sulfur protein [Ophidiomyces ophidiicola]|uniref:Mitochondrial matrix iron-sulfur protein n=1 Tax=Ophidiomyces ophidiicola TaxID=1387563 RepID=A0ACB8V3Z1_9EURO|nr:mitochondrial matrix iron-sulfur protein [Ophidiomyces ophidiicola]KAI1918067.1 mitochondrial matrix iron-sulfur protein [Ophidiomyces ophidiicola]KAI1924698.1 mitochondrial matrix iron-sulfur protein [Ophidiomyces ophidiicola]KAI1928949.1 mitochondrial matrix iron-sulfur protein [Ophidiomyces ophidiicola]KAI1952303.1 mitochondrial matrix iron-sulfur protein [Ophidiomyces ophidiicola]KAI1952608.1 mitochondrial matrix iron-sulfur protein [Ophidiomyces ophidiicola]
MNPWRLISQQLLRPTARVEGYSAASTPGYWNIATSSHGRRLNTASTPRRLSRRSQNSAHYQSIYKNFAQPRRRFSATIPAAHGHLEPPKPGEELHVTFIDKDGDKHDFKVSKGDNLLDIAQANDLEMEGACGGSCACSTCHVVVEDQDLYDKMPEPDDDENDMLDLAFGLTETSRLGCQVKMEPELDGLVVRLPSMTRNLQASDFAEKK